MSRSRSGSFARNKSSEGSLFGEIFIIASNEHFTQTLISLSLVCFGTGFVVCKPYFYSHYM